MDMARKIFLYLVHPKSTLHLPTGSLVPGAKQNSLNSKYIDNFCGLRLSSYTNIPSKTRFFPTKKLWNIKQRISCTREMLNLSVCAVSKMNKQKYILKKETTKTLCLNFCPLLCVTLCVSPVPCHLSPVPCHMSHVTCHRSPPLTPALTATHPTCLLTPYAQKNCGIFLFYDKRLKL